MTVVASLVRGGTARFDRRAGLLLMALGALGACDPIPSEKLAPVDARDAADPSHDEHAQCASTWQAIQQSIFTAKGCNADACHSARAHTGSLDLSDANAYAALLRMPAQAALGEPMMRVTPGEQALSFLYAKVAAATEETALPAGGGAPMPVGTTPLTPDQLTALKLWIRAGAPAQGVVDGTQHLLHCTQPSDADPNKTPRPPIPEPEVGFQLASGAWEVKAGGEAEVCFATYYDLTDRVPEWAKVPCSIGGREQTCVGYARRELSQDAQSHHSAIQAYGGEVPPGDPVWGAWRCAGGAHAGTPCDPVRIGIAASEGGADCGDDAVCQTVPQPTVGCIGYGPLNKEASLVTAGGAQAPVSAETMPDGVYAMIPLKGTMLWDSHGFNLTRRATTIDQYNTFWFARPEARRYPSQEIFTAGNIVIEVPPYSQRELCSTYTLPLHARLFMLSSHVHKRALAFRAWLPPNAPGCPDGGCRPSARTADYRSTQYNDPVMMRFSPQLAFDDQDPASRTIAFCARYDNGLSDPALLKRASRLPSGARCSDARACAGGALPGAPCGDDADCGEGGQCDACTVQFGFTTEDEMLFLLGSYYIVPPTQN